MLQDILKQKKFWIIVAAVLVIIALALTLGSKLKTKKEEAASQTKAKTDMSLQVKDNVSGEASSIPNFETENTKYVAPVSTLALDPSTKSVNNGESFTLNAMIEPKGKKISAVEIHVNFDPKLVSLDSIVPSGSYTLELVKGQIDNSAGTGWAIVAVPLGEDKPDSLSNVAELNFTTLGAGKAQIGFGDGTKASSDGDGPNNAIASKIPATVEIK